MLNLIRTIYKYTFEQYTLRPTCNTYEGDIFYDKFIILLGVLLFISIGWYGTAVSRMTMF